MWTGARPSSRTRKTILRRYAPRREVLDTTCRVRRCAIPNSILHFTSWSILPIDVFRRRRLKDGVRLIFPPRQLFIHAHCCALSRRISLFFAWWYPSESPSRRCVPNSVSDAFHPVSLLDSVRCANSATKHPLPHVHMYIYLPFRHPVRRGHAQGPKHAGALPHAHEHRGNTPVHR